MLEEQVLPRLSRCIKPRRWPTVAAKHGDASGPVSSSLVIARKPVCVVRGTKVTGAVRDHVDIAAMTRCRSAAEKFGAISYGMTPHSQYHSR